ncbi:MAG: DUF3021 family protein [Lachnospiraceae bacterium]|nr:DUF3021 family protein [Lachnospiraceae bacterium]
MDYLKRFIRNCFNILSCIIILMVIMKQFVDQSPVELDYLWLIILFSFLGNLPSVLLEFVRNSSYIKKGRNSEKKLLIVQGIHFLLVEVTVIGAAFALGIVHFKMQGIVLFFEVVIIYGIVCFLNFYGDKKASDQINQELQKRKHKEMY